MGADEIILGECVDQKDWPTIGPWRKLRLMRWLREKKKKKQEKRVGKIRVQKYHKTVVSQRLKREGPKRRDKRDEV